MIYNGIVTNIDNKSVSISLLCDSSCKNCGLCLAGSKNTPEKIIRLSKKNLQIKQGDMVKVEVKEPHIIGGSFAIFILPVLFIITGYYIVVKISINTVFISTIFTSIYLGILYILNKKFSKNIKIYTEKDNPS